VRLEAADGALAEPAAPLATLLAPLLRWLPPDSASGAMSSAGELVGSPLKPPAILPAGGIAGPGRLAAAVMGGGRTGARGGSADAGPGRLLLASVRLPDCIGSGCSNARLGLSNCSTGPLEPGNILDMARYCTEVTETSYNVHFRCCAHLVEACRWEAAA
jgi:hypothetical protein